jgi:hypothetical protein
MLPGETELTRTLFADSSIAKAFVNAITAPFVATYDVALACPYVPTQDAMLMMEPEREDEDDDDDDGSGGGDDDDDDDDDDESKNTQPAHAHTYTHTHPVSCGGKAESVWPLSPWGRSSSSSTRPHHQQ